MFIWLFLAVFMVIFGGFAVTSFVLDWQRETRAIKRRDVAMRARAQQDVADFYEWRRRTQEMRAVHDRPKKDEGFRSPLGFKPADPLVDPYEGEDTKDGASETPPKLTVFQETDPKSFIGAYVRDRDGRNVGEVVDAKNTDRGVEVSMRIKS